MLGNWIIRAYLMRIHGMFVRLVGLGAATVPVHPIARLGIGLAGVLWAHIGLGAVELTPFSATYNLTRAGVSIGKVLRTLSRQDDGTYVYESQSQSSGVLAIFLKDRVTERSRWQITDDTVRSIEYLYERTGGSKTRHVRLAFDWESMIVTNNVDGDPWKMPLLPGAMDKLLYQLAVMRDLRAGKRKLIYDVADGGKIKSYEFDIDGEEFIETQIGKLKSIRVTRNRDDRITTIWCAAEYGFIPVQIEQFEENHGLLRLTIESIDGIQPDPASGQR